LHFLKSKISRWVNENKAGRPNVAGVRVTLALVFLCSCILIFLGWSVGSSISAPTEYNPEIKQSTINLDPNLSVQTGLAEPNVTNSVELSSVISSSIESAFGLICKGKFDTAKELLKQRIAAAPGTSESAAAISDKFSAITNRLLEIIDEYQALSQKRQSDQQSAYQQQLDELEKLRTEEKDSDANDFAALITDANDANDIIKTLSVIAKTSELANDTQRAELLSSPYVKQVLQKAIDKAAALEMQGKWIDSYATCYAWLQAIDPNNEAYSDYADQLIEKAGIIASLQDSPCETREERFQGIRKEMFIRAIDALDTHYVSTIDYSQMATTAIKRCELIAEVMAAYLHSGRQLPAGMSQSEGDDKSFSPPDANELSAFQAALGQMLSEVESSKNSITPFPRSSEGSMQNLALSAGVTKDKFIEIFEWVLALNAVTVQLPRQMLVAQFSEAALSSLDPYTVIVWPRQVQDFEKMMTKEFTGIGVEITKQKGLLTVSSLLPDTPAYRAGLDAGDVITSVDGIDTKDMSLMCAVHKITGPKGTKVTLTIKRAGEEKNRDVTITRAKINVQSVRGWQRTKDGEWLYMIDGQDKIGYVRVTDCLASTASELEKVLNNLEADGLKGLILDLRFNPGGFLDSAVDITDEFVKDGLIVSTQPGFGRTPTYKFAHKRGTHPDYPLIVLINSNSASGAEIIAGALADQQHNRATLIGERTYGKGLVQGIIQFRDDGEQVKYTMSYYHLPSGQIVKSRDVAEKAGTKDWGIGPDIEVDMTNDELRKMLDIQRDNDVLVQAGRGEGRESPKKHTIEETLAADPQLAVALMVIKTKLIKLNDMNLKEGGLSLSFIGRQSRNKLRG
jgi:carboxyl-terminal processing protease